MPKAMSSPLMFRVGAVLAIVGCANVLLRDPISRWYADQYFLGWEYIWGLTGALQQMFLVGGLFLMLASLQVKHFENLKKEFRVAGEAAAVRQDRS